MRGLLLVAAWFRVDEPWPAMDPWCTVPFDAAAAKANCAGRRLLCVLSDDDRYTVDYESNGAEWKARLGAEVAIVPGRRHFAGKKQAEVLSLLKEMLAAADGCPDHIGPDPAAESAGL